MNILEKKPYPRETVMNTAVVDHTNAHVMKLQTTHISELDQKIETLNGRIAVSYTHLWAIFCTEGEVTVSDIKLSTY